MSTARIDRLVGIRGGPHVQRSYHGAGAQRNSRPGNRGIGHQHRQRRDPSRTCPRHQQAALLVVADLTQMVAATADQRLRDRTRQGVAAVRHRAGPCLGDRRRVLPRRVARDRLRPPGPVPDRRGRHARRPACQPRVLPHRGRHRDRLPPAPGPHRRDPPAEQRRPAGHRRGMCAANRIVPRSPRLPPRAHRHFRREVAARQLRPDHRRDPRPVHRITRRHGRRLSHPAPRTRAHARLDLAARPAACVAAAATGRRPHLPGRAARAAPVPGVGDRSQLARTTDKVLALAERMPGLVILPAHDPTAAQRLLDSAR